MTYQSWPQPGGQGECRQPGNLQPGFHQQAGWRPGDFQTPVELRCVLDVNTTMRRMIPMAVMFGFAIFMLAALVLGLTTQNGPASLVGAIAVGAAAAAVMYVRKQNQLRHTYGELQRLRLTPQGMVKVDGTLMSDMPWSGISRIEVRDSALPSSARVYGGGLAGGLANGAIAAGQTLTSAGIVGRAVLSPLPGASRKLLQAHERVGGHRGVFTSGRSAQVEQALIFPSEFEVDWTRGVIGAWLRHYRPDIVLPA